MKSRKVVLIGWDAADWKVIHPLMDAGKMPHVQRLVENGAMGQIATLHPPLSPMLWTSIATGKRPFKHGIHGFSEPAPDGRSVRPVTNLSRSSKAIWNILTQNDLRSTVIGWWPSHPAEPIDGVMVSDHYHRANGPLEQGWTLAANAIHPPDLRGVLAGLRVHPDSLTPALVEPFIPLAREIDQDKDKRLAMLLRTLAELMSMHAAAMWLIENRAWDLFTVYYDSIDHFCHGFMRYHPPKQSWVSERDFELYRNIVATGYQVHDRMLGELLAKADPDSTVILMSDHGFHPDHLRPVSIPDIPAGPAVEHREFGVLAISGPGVKKDELIHGASVLDVAPTVLTLFGLPPGEDMDGKVLSQAFENPPELAAIPSWEEVPGADGRHPPHLRLDPSAAHAAMEQMIALGYIERPADNRKIAVEKTIRELRSNLGESYQDAGRHCEAHAIFAELRAADPSDRRFAVRLFASCQALGLYGEMREILDDLKRDEATGDRATPLLAYLEAQVLAAEKRDHEALAALERVTAAHLLRPGLFLQTADLYLRLGRVDDAKRVYEKALALDPDNAHAHTGLSRVALRKRDFSASAHSALDSLQRVYHNPQAHFLLGLALTGMREYDRAADAFRTAISFNPHFPEAHSRLATLLAKHLNDPEAAREHRSLAREMKAKELFDDLAADPGPSHDLCAEPLRASAADLPRIEDCLVAVTGLPRSGTSMVMQMLAAGGMQIVSDGSRQADEDNPRGYLEFEPVKGLLRDSRWLLQERGKAIKIVVPLLPALPPALACRVILIERDPDEVLDSQARMLARRSQRLAPGETRERRRMLKIEYRSALARAKAMLAERPATGLLVIGHSNALSDPLLTAEKINAFLGGGLDVRKMAEAVDITLHRNRAAVTG